MCNNEAFKRIFSAGKLFLCFRDKLILVCRPKVCLFIINHFFMLIILLATIIAPVLAQAEVRVIDADTIDVDGKKVRLNGIDAFESGQYCEDGQKQSFKCGIKASEALKELLSSQENTSLICEFSDKDVYGRFIGDCMLGTLNINAWLVQKGWALAYRKYSLKYVQYENKAKINKAGVWSGKFIEPWNWRRGARFRVENIEVNSGCLIKGNISSNGEKIYHIETGQYYKRTIISLSKGERWFCTEEDALKNGWRRSKM